MISRNILGFSVTPNMMRLMECNGFYAAIMRADKKKKDEDGLPLGIPIPCLPVDYLKERPDFWIGGYGSYVCPVDSDWALWFNWTMNNWNNTAILPSVKGMNPISGQRISGLSLEQYREKCPVHNEKFKHKKLCEKCGFEWPDQNFISNPTPFYLDGFRTSDGKVRQFYFTEEMSKSIPELVIGKEDTVPAFGFCFYNLKDIKTSDFEDGNRFQDKKSEEYFKNYATTRTHVIRDYSKGVKFRKSCDCGGTFTSHTDTKWMTLTNSSPISDGGLDVKISAFNSTGKIGMGDDSPHDSLYISDASVKAVPAAACFHLNSSMSDYKCSKKLTKGSSSTKLTKTMGGSSPIRVRRSVEVGIGAGEEIAQEISRDKRSVDIWQERPAAIFRIYFVFQEQFEKYAKAGLKEIKSERDGFLAGCPVGGAK